MKVIPQDTFNARARPHVLRRGGLRYFVRFGATQSEPKYLGRSDFTTRDIKL